MNRKCLVIGIILLFAGTCIIPAIAQDTEKQSSRGNWLYVGGNGPGNYSRIQDAINDSSDGDTVFVYDDSSPYHEFIIINKTISLIGENQDTTIIEGYNDIKRHIIQINASDVHLHRFTIKNNMIIWPPDDYKVIQIFSDNNDISENILTDIADGIEINHASGNKIHDNIITNGTLYCTAVWIKYGNKNEIFNNTISSIPWGINIDGELLHHPSKGSGGNKVYKNSITHIQHTGISISGYNSKFNIIHENYISGTEVGISISWGDFFFVYFNEITNCSYGIGRVNTGFTVIMKNNFMNNSCNAAFYNKEFLDIWYRNYWDDWNGTGPYKINGEADGWDPDYPVSAIQYDRHPARKPYDIPRMC